MIPNARPNAPTFPATARQGAGQKNPAPALFELSTPDHGERNSL